MMTTVLLLAVVMGLQAQSLVGTWKTATETDKDGDKTTIFITFEQNGSASLKVQLEASDPEVGDFVFSVTIPGTYKYVDKALTLNMDSKKGEGKMEKMVFSKEIKDMLEQQPELKKTLNDMIQKQIDENLKKELADSTPLDGEVEIAELTSTTLIIVDTDDEKIVFSRVR